MAAYWTDLLRQAEALAQAARRPAGRLLPAGAAPHPRLRQPQRDAAGRRAQPALCAPGPRQYQRRSRARATALPSRRIRDTYNHELSGGKWNHLMDQTYLGYFDWYQPTADIPPPVTELDLPDEARFGVSVEGSALAWPGYYLPPALPAFDGLLRGEHWFEIFPRSARDAGRGQGRSGLDPAEDGAGLFCR